MSSRTTSRNASVSEVQAKKPAATKTKGVAKKTQHHNKMIGLYKEPCPEAHIIKGKFVFLYILFACTMLIFAGLTVWLFFFSTALLERYEAIDVCARAGNCEIIIEDENLINEEGVEE